MIRGPLVLDHPCLILKVLRLGVVIAILSVVPAGGSQLPDNSSSLSYDTAASANARKRNRSHASEWNIDSVQNLPEDYHVLSSSRTEPKMSGTEARDHSQHQSKHLRHANRTEDATFSANAWTISSLLLVLAAVVVAVLIVLFAFSRLVVQPILETMREVHQLRYHEGIPNKLVSIELSGRHREPYCEAYPLLPADHVVLCEAHPLVQNEGGTQAEVDAIPLVPATILPSEEVHAHLVQDAECFWGLQDALK